MLLTILDRLIISFDNSLKTLCGSVQGTGRQYPADSISENQKFSLSERQISIEQLRINHTGEICAQALYHSQYLFCSDYVIRRWLLHAAQEEQDHLIWCQKRLNELDGRGSFLNPFFYLSSYLVGATFSAMSDELNLGFIRATEDLVCEHLQRQIQTLDYDPRSKKVIEQMILDEDQHGQTAAKYGGVTFSPYIYDCMRITAGFMKITVSKI